jgi:hypothetical protein
MTSPELQDVSIVFDFVFVILCVAGLLGLLAHAAFHEDDDKRAVRIQRSAPQRSE